MTFLLARWNGPLGKRGACFTGAGRANVGKISTAISITAGLAADSRQPNIPKDWTRTILRHHNHYPRNSPNPKMGHSVRQADGLRKMFVFKKVPDKYVDDQKMLADYWFGKQQITESLMDHVRDHIFRICAIEDFGTPGNASMITRLLEPEQPGIALLIQHDLAHLYLHDVDIAQARIIIDNHELNPPRPHMWALQGRSFREEGVM
jgi:hypothetical protein